MNKGQQYKSQVNILMALQPDTSYSHKKEQKMETVATFDPSIFKAY